MTSSEAATLLDRYQRGEVDQKSVLHAFQAAPVVDLAPVLGAVDRVERWAAGAVEPVELPLGVASVAWAWREAGREGEPP